MSCAAFCRRDNDQVKAEEVTDYLGAGSWRKLFDPGALSFGLKLTRSRSVHHLLAETLETGDLEITGRVDGPQAEEATVSVVFWHENETPQCESTCSCKARHQCAHAVAALEYLLKGKPGQRLASALGESPHAGRMTQGQHLALPGYGDEGHSTDPAPDMPENAKAESPRFLLRVDRQYSPSRPASKSRSTPDVHARAFACYGESHVPLEPSGILPPLVLPDRKIPRDRIAEMEALKSLYALDLLPLDEESRPAAAPMSPTTERLWAPDNAAWPHADFYWQRFQHEATPALERRGWEVQFSAHVGLEPLVFRTESWRADIVEEGRGWFTLSAGFEINGESFDLQPILAALVANRFLEVTADKPRGQEFMIFLPDGRGLALPVGRFRRILKTLGELTSFKFTDGPLRITKVDAARLAQDEEFEVHSPDTVRELGLQLSHFEKIEPVPEPADLQAELRSYQRDGFHWMQFLVRHQLNGILADDMGLGKTLQALTHILSEIESGHTEKRPTLVVAPTSVVANWQREAAKFAPTLDVLLLQGADRHRRFAHIPSSDLVLTSYALLTRDLETLSQHDFHLVILDEAQHIKNAQAKVAQAACQIQAAHRLCLSGTPVENNLGELWSLMHFLMPQLLGSRETFNEVFRTPIERQGNEAKRQALAARVGPLVLRRSKHDVAKELPPKTEIVHAVELTDTQKELYETVRATMDKQVRQALELQGQQSQIVFLDALLKLRQICCHPRLLNHHQHATGSPLESASSAKFDYLTELLDTLRQEGHRTLLFSQFTSMLALIEAHLTAINCPYLKLTGASQNRQELVDRFQGGEAEVFLISLKAGGTGLTLTGADTVIHYDPWWNPAAENQATDRAYRIGQDKPVFVHKLICQGTVEERIQQMQQRKHHLASDLLSGATQQLTLTGETLQHLLGPLND